MMQPHLPYQLSGLPISPSLILRPPRPRPHLRIVALRLLQLGMHLLLPQSLNSFRFLPKCHLRKACGLKQLSSLATLQSDFLVFITLNTESTHAFFNLFTIYLLHQKVRSMRAGALSCTLLDHQHLEQCLAHSRFVEQMSDNVFFGRSFRGYGAVFKSVQSGARLFEIKFQIPACLLTVSILLSNCLTSLNFRCFI